MIFDLVFNLTSPFATLKFVTGCKYDLQNLYRAFSKKMIPGIFLQFKLPMHYSRHELGFYQYRSEVKGLLKC